LWKPFYVVYARRRVRINAAETILFLKTGRSKCLELPYGPVLRQISKPRPMACSLLSIRIIVSGSGHAAGASSGVVSQGGGNGAAHGNAHNK